MITQEHLDLLKQYLPNSQRILLLFPSNGSFDQTASATALYLSLKEQGKDVSLLTPQLIRTEFASLVGIQDARQELGNKNLQISFNYQEEMVDKVSYNIDEDQQKFHLVIQPKPGGKPLDTKTVEFSYIGADADLIITIGVGELESMEQLYIGYEDFFANTPLVSLHAYETSFGTVKLATEGTASFSEVTAYIIQEAELPMDSDIATNLLSGVEEATDNFRSFAATADTFEIASQLLRHGARRVTRNKVEHSSMNGFAEAFARTSRTTPRINQERVNRNNANDLDSVQDSAPSATQTSTQPQKSKSKQSSKMIQNSGSENLG